MKKLETIVKAKQTMLCVGMDLPADKRHLAHAIINKTLPVTAAYKFNLAFWMDDTRFLREIINEYKDEAYIILDGKFNDIDNTMSVYADMAYNAFQVDGATVSPFMGIGGVKAFLDTGDAFILCAPTNKCLGYEDSMEIATTFHRTKGGYVVGANRPEAAAMMRYIVPDAWFLAPGVGVQGGDLTAFMPKAIRADKNYGVLTSVSRSIILSDDPRRWAQYYRDTGLKAAGL